MSQRNNLQPDPPPRANAFAASAGAALSTSSPARTRRPVRIAVSLPVEVRDQFGRREETRTHFVTVRGAVLPTSADIRIGHKLTLQNLKNGRTAECHVVGVESALKQVHEVEVEFTEPQPDFWPVQFPAEDFKAGDASSSGKLAVPVVLPVGENVSNGSKTSEHELLSPSEPVSKPTTAARPKVSDDIVVLADSVAKDFTPASGTQKFTARTGGVDSVAQFRAANRAAHRREQRRKAFLSLVMVLALAGSVYGGRTWLLHKAAEIASPKPEVAALAPVAKSEQIVQTPSAPKPSPSAPIPAVAAQPAASPTQNFASEQPATDTVASIPAESAPVDTQVSVRHGSSVASSRKPAVEQEEEPMALPLRVSDGPNSQAKPELLSSVVAQAPTKAAVLAPQLPKRVVPAKLTYSVPAQYPAMARQIHAEGEVVLKLDVDSSGNVTNVQAVSGAPLLRGAALEAVRKWKYQPATLGDKAVASTEMVKIDFHLK